MIGNEMVLNLPIETRSVLEGQGRQLDTAVIVSGASTFLVLSFHVDYRKGPLSGTRPELVKFSEKDHAIPLSRQLWLRTSKYYRELEGTDPGIADAEEARFVEKGTLGEFVERHGTRNFQDHERVSTEVTWGISDFWMFCTSMTPTTTMGFSALHKEFPDKECPTLIPNPSEFALQLGKDFGNQISTDDILSNGFEAIRLGMFPLNLDWKITNPEVLPESTSEQQALESAELPDKIDLVVFVDHGPVVYTDQPVRLLDIFPEDQRSLVIPFVKRTMYQDQREYRFTLAIGGQPKCKTLKMDISDRLRNLTHLRSGNR